MPLALPSLSIRSCFFSSQITEDLDFFFFLTLTQIAKNALRSRSHQSLGLIKEQSRAKKWWEKCWEVEISAFHSLRMYSDFGLCLASQYWYSPRPAEVN